MRFDKTEERPTAAVPVPAGRGEFEPMDLNLNIRGNPESLGELVPRRFPLALSAWQADFLNEGSGRLQLAERWRTIRWPPGSRSTGSGWLFGQALVRTPRTSARVGDRPALPELLEFLAARFVRGGTLSNR